MSLQVDHKYVGLISYKLDQFKKKSDRLYNFRCPYCNDSQKNRFKARGYLFEKNGSLRFKCHNCDVSTNVGKLIDLVDPSLLKQYQTDKFKDSVNIGNNLSKITIPTVEKPKPKTILDDMFPKISELPPSHKAVNYIQSRRIPKSKWDDLYYVRNMKDFEKLNSSYKDRIIAEERVVIPFRNEDGELTGVSGRALGNSSLRYVTVRLSSDALVYGLDRVEKSQKVYVTEGPIDSMFIDNAIGAGGTDFNRAIYKLSDSNIVLIFDNQPRNKQVVKRVETYASRGFSMIIWDQEWTYKDINDAIVAGMSTDYLRSLLERCTFSGLELKLAIRNWKKC